MLIHLSKEQNFKELVSKGITLVDFYATWCGPCRMLAPELEKLAEVDQSINVIKVDVDECPEVAGDFGIRAVPTLILFKDGAVVTSSSGYRPFNSLKNLVDSAK